MRLRNLFFIVNKYYLIKSTEMLSGVVPGGNNPQ